MCLNYFWSYQDKVYNRNERKWKFNWNICYGKYHLSDGVPLLMYFFKKYYLEEDVDALHFISRQA